MGNYRRKQFEIDAVRVSDVIPKATSNWNDLPSWVQIQYAQGNLIFGAAYLIINGGDVANFDDWLIQDENGTLCACKPDIFTATYEEVPN